MPKLRMSEEGKWRINSQIVHRRLKDRDVLNLRVKEQKSNVKVSFKKGNHCSLFIHCIINTKQNLHLI